MLAVGSIQKMISTWGHKQLNSQDASHFSSFNFKVLLSLGIIVWGRKVLIYPTKNGRKYLDVIPFTLSLTQ